MLTDSELDDCLWDFVADGSASAAQFARVVEQAKLANQYRQAMRTIAASGNARDKAVALAVMEATNDGIKATTP